jgi:hypothetical protein
MKKFIAKKKVHFASSFWSSDLLFLANKQVFWGEV